jgi:hypothetical protein
MAYNQKFKEDLFKLLVSNPEFIHIMLKYELPIPIETKDENNNTLLNRLLIENDIKNANILLENIKNDVYSDEIEQMLLNEQNNDGNAPIHIAILNNYQDIAKILYKLGADITKPNKENYVVEYTDSEKNKEETCDKSIGKKENMSEIFEKLNKPMPPSNMNEIFERPIKRMPPIMTDLFERSNRLNRSIPSHNINYVVENDIQQPNLIKPNDIQFIINQLSAPVREVSIPQILGSIDSTEIMPHHHQKKKETSDEFKFLQNFLGKDSNNINYNRLDLDTSSKTVDTAEFMQFLKQNNKMRSQSGGGNNSSVNTNEFLKYISQQNIQDGGYIKNEVITGTRQLNKVNKYETDLSSVNSTLDIKDVIEQQRGGRKKAYRFDPDDVNKRNKKLSKKKNTKRITSIRRNTSRSHSSSIMHGRKSSSSSSKMRKHKSSRSNSKMRKHKSSRSNSSSRRRMRRQLRRNMSSRSLSRPSSDLHQEVVDILKKNYSLSEDDARYIKAGFYHMIKDKFPNLSNMQRALKLKEMSMDENEVNQMKKKLPELKEIVTKARELKKNSPQNNNPSKTPKEAKKTKDPKEKVKTVKKK